MNIDVIYKPEPLENKPDWFNGFLKIGSVTEKSGWDRYIYIPDYYSEDAIGDTVSFHTIDGLIDYYLPRFGYTDPRINCVPKEHLDNIDKDYAFRSGGKKHQVLSQTLRSVNCYNMDTQLNESRRYFFSNSKYIVRQRNRNETDKIINLIKRARIENPTFAPISHFIKIIERGHMAVAVDISGNLVGIQTFKIKGENLTAEPMTYIAEEARGQGIFAVYHEISLDAARGINAEYIYSRCRIDNETMCAIYEKYGYERQKDLLIEPNRTLYQFKYYMNER